MPMPPRPKPQLVLFPGLGATCELMQPQLEAFEGEVLCPDWIDPIDRGEPLDHYAHRLSIELAPKLDAERPRFLGGVSFGGILAQELARFLPCRAVLVIASVRSSYAVPGRVRTLARMESVLPGAIMPVTIRLGDALLGMALGLEREQYRLFRRSTVQGPRHVRAWAERALAGWRSTGVQEGSQPPVHQIHGSDDAIFPLDLQRGVPDVVIPGGHHLIQLSHAERVNHFLRERMTYYTAGREE
ncbi:MAG: alpha/beta fold hydrolase [Phycisphaeraceae bacterium]